MTTQMKTRELKELQKRINQLEAAAKKQEVFAFFENIERPWRRDRLGQIRKRKAIVTEISWQFNQNMRRYDDTVFF